MPGAGQTGPMADVPIERVRRLFEVNVFGTLSVTQHVLKGMVAKGSGRVIIMSSIAGVLSAPTFGPYSMTKHALEAMGKAMRGELAPLGIDVTLLNPGPYQTGFNDRMAEFDVGMVRRHSVNASASDLFRSIGDMVTTGQMDPAKWHSGWSNWSKPDHHREQLRATRDQSPGRRRHRGLRPSWVLDAGLRGARTAQPVASSSGTTSSAGTRERHSSAPPNGSTSSFHRDNRSALNPPRRAGDRRFSRQRDRRAESLPLPEHAGGQLDRSVAVPGGRIQP